MKLQNTYKKRLLIGAGALAIAVGAFTGTQIFQEEKDPLQELLGDILFEESYNFKADFFTDSVSSYTGPKSADIQSCMDSAAASQNKGVVYATLDEAELVKLIQEKEAGTFNRLEVKGQLLPVLGYAMQNSQINWDWKPETKSYEFYMNKGEEPFWDCYFDLTSETEFFPRFFSETHYDELQLSSDSTIVISEDTGENDSDGVTSDNTLVISGVAEKNATITIYINGVAVGTTESDDNGNYSFDYTGTVLSDGEYELQTTATIGDGTSEKSDILVVKIDTHIADPIITTPTSGSPVTGTAEAGAIIVVTTPSGSTCTTEVNASGFWSCTLSPEAENGEDITATATDRTGNTATTTVEGAIDNDTTPPPAPNQPANLIDSSDTGADDKDNITNDTTPTFELYCTEAGSTLSLYVDEEKVGTVQCVSDTDSPEITLTASLSDGIHRVEYIETDSQGNESGKSPLLEILIDTTAPTETSSLSSPKEPTSNLNAPLVGSCGQDAANGTVEVTSDPINGFTPYPATAQLDAIGNFNISVLWKEGTYNVVLNCYDKAGNGPITSTAGPVVIDATAPGSPTEAPDLVDASDSGESNTDNITNETTPVFTIPCENGDTTVTLYDGNTVVGTANCVTAGEGVEIAIGVPFPEGSHHLTYTYTDSNGNESNKSPELEIIIDTTASTEEPSLISPTVSTNNENAPLVGSCGADSAGGRITITSTPENGFTPYPVDIILDGLGNFSTSVTWQEGEWMLTFNCYDKAGNGPTTKEQGPVIIDITPADISGKIPDLQSSSDTGVSDTDNITNDNTPTIDIVCTEKGSTITLFVDNTAIEPVQVCEDAGSVVSFTSSLLSDGNHDITYTETDSVGNVSDVSDVLTVTIDTTAPTAPTEEEALTSPTSGTNDENAPIIGSCGTDAANGSVVITTSPENGFTPYPANQSPLASDGSFNISGLTWTEGTYDIIISCTDAAGNGPTTTTQGPVIIDLTPLDISGKIPDLQSASDTGVSDTDNITNDNTPTIDIVCTEKDSTITLFVDNTAIEPVQDCEDAGSVVSFTSSLLSDGNHDITYTETDSVGNVSDVSDVLTVTIDTTAPTEDATLTSPESSTNDENAPLIGSCGEDAKNGSVVITTSPENGFSPYPANQSPLASDGSFNITGLTWEAGTYDIIINCYDEAGNGPKETVEGPISSCSENTYGSASYDSCNAYE